MHIRGTTHVGGFHLPLDMYGLDLPADTPLPITAETPGDVYSMTCAIFWIAAPGAIPRPNRARLTPFPARFAFRLWRVLAPFEAIRSSTVRNGAAQFAECQVPHFVTASHDAPPVQPCGCYSSHRLGAADGHGHGRMTMDRTRVGIDIGGTFTDFLLFAGETVAFPSPKTLPHRMSPLARSPPDSPSFPSRPASRSRTSIRSSTAPPWSPMRSSNARAR